MSLRFQNPRLSTGGGLVAIVLWSTTFALARSLTEQLGPWTAAAAVYLIGGLGCLARLGWSGNGVARVLALPRKYLFGCGFLFIAYSALIYLAVARARDREQLLEVGLVNYLWPAATILFSRALLKQRASLLLAPGTAIALAGVFLVMTHGARVSWGSVAAHLHSNPAAYGLAFAAAMAWALYSNLTRRWAGTEASGATEVFVPATGVVLLALRLAAHESATWTLQAAVEAIALGAITALAYGLWDLAMRKGDLLFVAACSYFTPLLSTLVSCIYLKVMPGPHLWIGSLLIAIGSLASWWSVAAPGRNPPAATIHAGSAGPADVDERHASGSGPG